MRLNKFLVFFVFKYVVVDLSKVRRVEVIGLYIFNFLWLIRIMFFVIYFLRE